MLWGALFLKGTRYVVFVADTREKVHPKRALRKGERAARYTKNMDWVDYAAKYSVENVNETQMRRIQICWIAIYLAEKLPSV